MYEREELPFAKTKKVSSRKLKLAVSIKLIGKKRRTTAKSIRGGGKDRDG